MSDFNGDDRKLLRDIDRSLVEVRTKVEAFEGRLDGFVTKDAFAPVARIAYGLAGSVLTAVMGAAMWVILK